MILAEAKRLCPDAVILPSDYETYSIFSERMYRIVGRYSPTVEEYSIDECFADLTGLRRVLRMNYYDMARASAGAIGASMQSGEAVKTINGMILKRVGTLAMNGMTTTEVATSVSTAPIPPSTFEPPSGYKKVPKKP